jgi:hypothetical protein
MTKIVCLISVIGLAAGASTPPSPQSRPTIEEKLNRELERAQDRTIHDVIWTLQNVGRRVLRDAISGMDLETLMAFTLTDDHRRQLAVWSQVRNDPYGVSHYTVRRLLTEKSIAAASRLGRFVGAEAYEQAGGSKSRDLFSDDGYFDDVKLVRQLALQKLEAKARELEATWKWAKPMLEPDYGFAAEFARIHPRPISVPAEVTEELMGFSDGAVDQLKALGLISDIITWRPRLFIPTTGAGIAVLGALLDRHPVLHCTRGHGRERETAL